jgi:hypothetical protein
VYSTSVPREIPRPNSVILKSWVFTKGRSCSFIQSIVNSPSGFKDSAKVTSFTSSFFIFLIRENKFIFVSGSLSVIFKFFPMRKYFPPQIFIFSIFSKSGFFSRIKICPLALESLEQIEQILLFDSDSSKKRLHS